MTLDLATDLDEPGVDRGIPYPDPPLRDGHVKLRPFTRADKPWFADFVARLLAADPRLHPTTPLRLFGDRVTHRLHLLAELRIDLVDGVANELAGMWGTGERATFLIDAGSSVFGFIWVGSTGIVGGGRIPPDGEPLPVSDEGVYDDEANLLADPLTIARAIRLIVGWAAAEPHIRGTPLLGFPCRNPKLVAWAERNGFEWVAE